LLDSVPRQMLLYEHFGWADAVPRYWHLPLVIGEDGRRLAKRHGDTRISTWRERGVAAGEILTLLARWCGIEWPGRVNTAADLLDRFDINRLPREPIVYR